MLDKAHIDDVKLVVRRFLHERAQPVPAKRDYSQKKHLEVHLVGPRRRPLGLEVDHDGLVNFWILQLHMPRFEIAGIDIVKKQPKGANMWTDENGKGANHNLSAYDEFRKKPIARIKVQTTQAALEVLDHLAG